VNKKKLLSDYIPLIQSKVISPNHGHYSATLRETEGSEMVLKKLAQESSEGKTLTPRLHFGWGSYRNLDIAAARRSDYVILADVSLRQIEMWNLTMSALRVVDTPEEFISFFTSLVPKNPRPRFPVKKYSSFKEWLLLDLKREMSWLNQQQSFLHIKKLVKENRIELICCDIRDTKVNNGLTFFEELNNSLKEMMKDGFAIPDTYYVSNLPWIMKAESGFFGEMHLEDGFETSFPGYGMLVNNLKTIAPSFQYAISAHLLSDKSVPTSVQWKTSLFKSDAFIKAIEEDKKPNKYPLHQQSL